MQTTCKDCPDRYPGCHDHCEKYQSRRAADWELKKKIRDETRGGYEMMKLYSEKKNKKLKKYPKGDIW